MSDEREDELIRRVARELRRPVSIDPALDDRVMAQVEAIAQRETLTRRAERPSRLSAAWAWLRQPRTISVSPLGALAAAAVVGVVLLGTRDAGPGMHEGQSSPEVATQDSSRVPGPASRVPQAVQFVLVAPGASTVSVVGDFNGWDSTATRLQPAAAGGMWSVTVPLEPGRHRYAFIVDGRQWQPDPNAPRARDDDFGVPSSVVTVGERRT